jgi:hypothetical protein
MIQKKWALDLFETTHTILKKYHKEMVPSVFPILNKYRKQVEKVAPWLAQIKSNENLEYYIDLISSEWSEGKSLRYALFNQNKNHYFGHIGVHNFRENYSVCSMGYWTTGEQGSHELLIESVMYMERVLFKIGIKTIEVSCFTSQKESHYLPKKLNYKLKTVLNKGEANESYVFSKSNL